MHIFIRTGHQFERYEILLKNFRCPLDFSVSKPMEFLSIEIERFFFWKFNCNFVFGFFPVLSGFIHMFLGVTLDSYYSLNSKSFIFSKQTNLNTFSIFEKCWVSLNFAIIDLNFWLEFSGWINWGRKKSEHIQVQTHRLPLLAYIAVVKHLNLFTVYYCFSTKSFFTPFETKENVVINVCLFMNKCFEDWVRVDFIFLLFAYEF